MQKRISFQRGRRHQELTEIRRLTTGSIVAAVIIIFFAFLLFVNHFNNPLNN